MTTKPNKSSSFKFTLLKWSCIILLLGLISLPITRVFVVFFGKIDQRLRARIFMSYRENVADSMMINGRYKSIKPNSYPTDENRNAFNKIAQDKKTGVLTKYNYPEHFAREPEWNFTFCDEVYYRLWKIRVNVCEFLGKTKQDNPKELVVPEKGAKVDFFFRQVPKMSDEDYKGLFKNVDEKGKGWAAAADKFIEMVLTLIDKPSDYKLKGDDVPDKLKKDIKEFASQLGYSKEKITAIEAEIPAFFIKYGEAYPTVFHSTIYSRLYYFFIFLTINGEFDYSEIETTKEMKIEEYNKQAMKVLATVFAQIFSRVYEEDYNFELKDGGIKAWFVKHFGPKQDISKVKDQKENIKKVKEVLMKNRQLLK